MSKSDIQICENGDFKCFQQSLVHIGYDESSIIKESDGDYHDCRVMGVSEWYVEIKARKMWVDDQQMTYRAILDNGKFKAGNYIGGFPWIQTDKVARVEHQAEQAGTKGAIAMIFVPSNTIYFFSIDDIKTCEKTTRMMNKNTMNGEPKIMKEVYEVPLTKCIAKIPMKKDFEGYNEWVKTVFNKKGED